jgi:hypothetical protein
MNQLQPLWGLGGSPLETGGRNSRLTHNRLFPGRRRCCDVAYLSQAFSQHTGPGRLWISLGTILLPDPLAEMDRTKQ